MDLAQQASVSRFLEAWHENRWEDARFIASFFGRETREAETARFLLDQRPLREKITEFKQRLPLNQPCFGEFIIAEHHHKDKNWREAIAAYQRCLSYDDYLKDNKWLVAQAQSRLYELTENDHSAETSSATRKDEP
jgi:hypothetical protein